MKPALAVTSRTWRLKEPFVISRETFTTCEVIVVHLECDGHIGRGEGKGVLYHGETPATMREQIEAIRGEIFAGAGRHELLDLLPAGGARNAVDAALWDLEAKLTGVPAWRLAGVEPARPVVTTVTIGIRDLDGYEARARSLSSHPWLKIKVSNDEPLEAIAAVRRGAPNARLVVDANQAWSVLQLQELAPALAELKVDVLEQPVPGAEGDALRGLELPIPVCADEPANTAADLPQLIGRYDFVNIKLDKSGGLTAALDFAHAARAAGLRLMAGCMTSSSLSMAPAMVLAQLCEVADLDGPLLLAEDCPNGIVYREGLMSPPSPALWG